MTGPEGGEFIMYVHEPYNTMIKQGLKTMEIKEMDEYWQNLQPGDKIKIICDESYPFFVFVTNISMDVDIINNIVNIDKIMPGATISSYFKFYENIENKVIITFNCY